MVQIKRIGCIGAGYVGGPTMATIAAKCPNIDVYIYDLNQARIDAWNSEKLPIYEPGLDELVKSRRGKNLFFTTNYEEAVIKADMIFLAVNTPTKHYGVGKGRAAELKNLELCARELAERVQSGYKIVVEKSTVPIRTSLIIKNILQAQEGAKFDILSNPEFLAEGSAVQDLENPDRVLIGGENEAAVKALFDIYNTWVPKERIITTNLWSSELSKLVGNCLLAQRISSINAISALCEITGAEVAEVSRAVGADSRISKKFLQASAGFGGSCFQKDILNLIYLAEHYGLKQVADYFMGIIQINEWQKERFVAKIINRMFNTVAKKKLAILGFAFKKDTSDTRESSAIYICQKLLNERGNLCIYDPKVPAQQVFSDLKAVMNDMYEGDYAAQIPEDSDETKLVKQHVTVANSIQEAVQDAHALIILTEWDEFKNYDYQQIYNAMKKPAFIFDGRKLLNVKQLQDIGFRVYAIGTPDAQGTQW